MQYQIKMYRVYSVATNGLITDNSIGYRVLWGVEKLWATQQISRSIKKEIICWKGLHRTYIRVICPAYRMTLSRNNLFPNVRFHYAGRFTRPVVIPKPQAPAHDELSGQFQYNIRRGSGKRIWRTNGCSWKWGFFIFVEDITLCYRIERQ